MKRVPLLALMALMILLISCVAHAETWYKVTFTTPYAGEKSMKLLIEWAFGEYDMALVDKRWMVTLELPKGRYAYTFSNKREGWDPPFRHLTHFPAVYPGYSHVVSEHFRIYYSGLTPDYLDAFRRIFETTYEGLKELFGLDLQTRFGNGQPLDVLIDVTPENPPRASAGDCIRFQLAPEYLKAPPAGPHHVYGIAHELAHQIIRFNTMGASEAFADVIASYLISHYIWPRLGPSAWPDPYDYNALEGEARSLSFARSGRYPELAPDFTIYLWNLLQEKGPAFLGRIINTLPLENVTEEDFRRLCAAAVP